jgi:hypothetical protein
MTDIECLRLALADGCAVVPDRENNTNTKQFSGRFSDLCSALQPLPVQNGQWDDAAKVCAWAQRTHTAARPSRIFTVFPFHYSAENSSQT